MTTEKIWDELIEAFCPREDDRTWWGKIVLKKDEPAYHKSWDWQIPVWSKIVPLIKNIATEGSEADYKQYMNILNEYESAVAANNPMRGCLLVSKAIQWYTQLNKGVSPE